MSLDGTPSVRGWDILCLWMGHLLSMDRTHLIMSMDGTTFVRG